MEVGAVAGMRFVKDGIKAAKLVMDHTEHTLLVGEMASVFAISMGLPGPTNLSSSESIEKWSNWKQNQCQPNFRKKVFPENGCGPYHLHDELSLCGEAEGRNCFGTLKLRSNVVGRHNHDTISMAVIDKVIVALICITNITKSC
jgi:N4-(beta-N-acetylglucosaminyl)-L-asparaginase